MMDGACLSAAFFCCKGAKSSAVLIQICQPKKETNGTAYYIMQTVKCFYC
jgi:hypothetical protein